MQQHGSKYLARRPNPPRPSLGMAQLVKFQLFQHMVMLNIKIKGTMQQHGSNYLSVENPLPTRPYGMWSKVIIQLFSEHGQVAYQIKNNHEWSNMVANNLPADPTSPRPNLGIDKLVKFQFFQHMFTVHIKLKGIMNAATWTQMFCAAPPPPPPPPPPQPLTLGLGSKGYNFTFRTWSCCIAN